MSNASAKILFVENNAANRRVVQLYVQSFGCESLEVQPVAEEQLVESLRRPWDALLLSGELTSEEKARARRIVREVGSHVPVVELGDRHDTITSAGGHNLGDYLPKMPVSIDAVMRSVGSALTVRRLERELEAARENLGEASRTDPTTGLWTRAYATERISEEFMSWQRYKTPLTICLFSLLRFEALNKEYGFDVCEIVLERIGGLVRNAVRGTDFAGRLGHDTFALGFPKTPAASALIGIERLRKEIGRQMFSGKSTSNFTVEAAFGVVQLAPSHADPDAFIGTAHEALKRARERGPGSIEVTSHVAPTGPRVLIVGGHSSIRDFCCDVLQENDFLPSAAGSAREAIQLLRTHKFDLYVVEAELPGGESEIVLDAIHERPEWRGPVVLVEGERRPSSGDLLGWGVADTLKKPFSSEALLESASRLAHPHLRESA